MSEVFQAQIDGQENFLTYIVHIARPTQQPVCQGGDVMAMVFDDYLKSCSVTLGESLNQGCVVTTRLLSPYYGYFSTAIGHICNIRHRRPWKTYTNR